MLMTRSMSSPIAPRWKRTLDHALRLTRPALRLHAPDESDELEYLRALCHELVSDLPQAQRHVIGVVLLHARGRQDILHLRAQLFDAISHQFGERVARERLQRLDAALR
jgi:hypothetical protein